MAENESEEWRILIDVQIPLIAEGPKQERFNLFLALGSGLLLGCAFPPSPLYTLAYVAFIPYFILFERISTYRQLIRYSYVFLFVFHLITLYWTGGWTHGRDGWLMTSNAALLLAHPFFYMPSIVLAFFIRRRMGMLHGLASFIFLWIAYEYSHSLSEFSFPWITIGNSQAYDLLRSQLVEYTSSYGMSFLILSFNAVAFILLIKLASTGWRFTSRSTLAAVGVLIVIYVGPVVYGSLVSASERGREPASLVKLGLIQPNIDPWEKWGEGFASKWTSYRQQFERYLRESQKISASNPDLIVWPETAIPYPILIPRFWSDLPRLHHLIDSINIPVLTGLHHLEYSDSANASVTSQRVGPGQFAESFNSLVLIEPGRRIAPVYKKIVLVPFAERIPYAETLKFLIEPLKWNVGISSWGKGADTLVYSVGMRDGRRVQFSAMICYESVYPNFVREFVRKGAEFLVVVTNDSWWGNTSGTYQHAAYASLRAIENRRWVVQCANGGISEFVDPLGNVYSPTQMYTEAHLLQHIEPRLELTFYAKHGDVFAQACLFCSVVFVILAFVEKFRKKRRDER
ncbi:MAG: apolipoprotein N-acyltransferase [Ignavibacteriales bacterium]|nr:apolipoprotein N-acyltransferase [Ignavibacteriales bacterium]